MIKLLALAVAAMEVSTARGCAVRQRTNCMGEVYAQAVLVDAIMMSVSASDILLSLSKSSGKRYKQGVEQNQLQDNVFVHFEHATE